MVSLKLVSLRKISSSKCVHLTNKGKKEKKWNGMAFKQNTEFNQFILIKSEQEIFLLFNFRLLSSKNLTILLMFQMFGICFQTYHRIFCSFYNIYKYPTVVWCVYESEINTRNKVNTFCFSVKAMPIVVLIVPFSEKLLCGVESPVLANYTSRKQDYFIQLDKSCKFSILK